MSVDLEGLPAGVLAQLSKRARKINSHDLCRDVLIDAGGGMDLDEIIVAVWRKHGVLIARDNLSRALTYLRRRGGAERIACGRWRAKGLWPVRQTEQAA